MSTLIPYLTLACLLGAGLMAGLFFTFSTFVMQALARLTPAEGIRAMQQINLTVMNPLTMGAFFATALLGLVLLGYGVWRWSLPGSWMLAVGGLFYVFGAFGVTAAGNVPLNDRLAEVEAETEAGEQLWAHYLKRWMFWNHVRTFNACVAIVLMGLYLWQTAG